MTTNATKRSANCDNLTAFFVLNAGLRPPQKVESMTYTARQKYICSDCGRQFGDLTNIIFVY